jgi:hypothetical protein
MVFSVQQIKYEFLAYIKEFGGAFDQWYVGVAIDPEAALFSSRNVDQKTGHWIYKPALTFKATGTVLQYFRQQLKTDGDAVGLGTEAMTYVFAFKKTATTSPALTDDATASTTLEVNP